MTRVARLRVRDLRTYEAADVALGPGVTVVAGPNGVGKTNLLEALYLGCTGRSFRHVTDRDLVRRDAEAAHVGVTVAGPAGEAELSVGVAPAVGERHRLRVDGTPVDSLLDEPRRPLVSVFLPDRMVLVKGGPALRRAHLDQLMVALRPTTGVLRGTFLTALRQRNALLSRLREAGTPADRAAVELAPWDGTLAEAAARLTQARAAAVTAVDGAVAARAGELGLEGRLELRYRPRSSEDPAEVVAALRDRLPGDLDRGFTHNGPHRDELAVRRDDRPLARFGSQGEQRIALLALIVGEADALERADGRRPVLLLDDVMSELDRGRRERLVATLAVRGQTIVTVTEAEHVPGAVDDEAIGLVEVEPGRATVRRTASGATA